MNLDFDPILKEFYGQWEIHGEWEENRCWLIPMWCGYEVWQEKPLGI